VICRRIDDPFLDPEVFRPDSLLGVPGLIRHGAEEPSHLSTRQGLGWRMTRSSAPICPP
jgi:uncharacterized circularly permuted ATP-grasp superfamily protein